MSRYPKCLTEYFISIIIICSVRSYNYIWNKPGNPNISSLVIIAHCGALFIRNNLLLWLYGNAKSTFNNDIKLYLILIKFKYYCKLNNNKLTLLHMLGTKSLFYVFKINWGLNRRQQGLIRSLCTCSQVRSSCVNFKGSQYTLGVSKHHFFTMDCGRCTIGYKFRYMRRFCLVQ